MFNNELLGYRGLSFLFSLTSFICRVTNVVIVITPEYEEYRII